jgi:hypothetical protein
MFLIVLVVVLIVLLPITSFAIDKGVPFFNRLSSFLWQDPSERQKAIVLKRLKELHVDGNVPEEMSYLMAAKELNTTEQELKAIVGSVGAPNLVGLLTGRKTLMGVFIDSINKNLRKKN